MTADRGGSGSGLGSSFGSSFSIDDAVTAIDKKEIFEHYWRGDNDKYYLPPLDWDAIAKSYHANPFHTSAIQAKRNILISTFVEHPKLTRTEFEKLVTDYLIFGNDYLRAVQNRAGHVMRYEALKARWMRVGKKNDYYYLRNREAEKLKGDITHHKNHDINQDIYGVPEYMAGMNSAWLGEAATLFRRKYYKNGSHAGYILHITENLSDQVIASIESQLAASKGVGNFKNLMVHNPEGKKDGIELIPIAEVQARDEFYNIKTLTRDDILATHRVPPQLMSVIPTNTAGFGDVEKASKVFVINELIPLQQRLKTINEMVGETIIAFGDYELIGESV
ncbi:phage portal protein [Cardiobacteriales bacterium ML27]|uniref:Phage portal protein n=2 Tax=Ostreibacterium oceani TaxID=2654998 RepID=A0A6N7EZX8_9GAMM|nr:phage portal protein [Ostreibacterium oceani]